MAAPQRFIVDTREIGSADDVDMIHRLEPVNVLVVRGSEQDVPWYRDLVLSTVPTGTGAAEYDNYDWKAGTSMAAPQVAAAGALVKSVDSGAMPYEIEGTLKGAASIPEGYSKQYYGEGLLDTLGAVQS